MIHDVGEQEFKAAVVDRSHQVPVVVDFWAEWCGPCRQLSPALEAEAGKRGDDVDLVTVDVDANQGLAQSFGVQGIPAVKAFRGGEVVSEFTGAIPPAQVGAFFDALVPSEADRLADSEDEGDLRRALELDPRNSKAATRLARLLLARGDNAAAAELLEPFEGDFVAAGLAARSALALEDPPSAELAAAFTAWDGGEHAEALEALQQAVVDADQQERRDQLRRVMVAIFTELGSESELAREHRRRLALALT
jgi:putative thioredoxin